MLAITLLVTVFAANELKFRLDETVVFDAAGQAITLGLLLAAIVSVALLVAGVRYTMINEKSVDFLIDVESELMKVSWSTWPDLRNGTIVVIVLCLLFGAFVFAVDVGLAKLMDKLI